MISNFACCVALCAAGLFGCSAGGTDHPLVVGSTDGTGGVSSGGGNATGGAAPIVVGDAGASKALSAHIEHDHIKVEIVTLGCAGECAEVMAVATGGNAPYSFAWEDGSTSPARTICPTATTGYRVSVTDTGIASSEFRRDPQTVQVPLTANVLSCPDGGTADSGSGVCSFGAPPQAGHYVGTIECPSPPSSGGAAGATGSVTLDFAPDGSGTLFFQWSLVVIGAQGTLTPVCSTGALHETWSGAWGVPTFPDPNDPKAPPTLIPTGPITGDLTVVVDAASPSSITGAFNWNAPPVANQEASICRGSFKATLQP